MSIVCKVEHIPSHARTWGNVEFARVPCVGERLYTDDKTFEVKTVFHPFKSDDPIIVRVA